MEAVIEAIPQTGDIRLTIVVSARQNFSPKSAQKLVRRFVADEISYLLRAGEPDLVVGQQLCWRVPVQLAFPGQGIVDTVGTIDVNVEKAICIAFVSDMFPCYNVIKGDPDLAPFSRWLLRHYSTDDCHLLQLRPSD